MASEPSDLADLPMRPGDLARLWLAATDRPPRQRARDQQADRIGEALRRSVLDRLAALDPEPDALDQALAQIINELGEPTGPTRGVCALFQQEWLAWQHSPESLGWLLAEAIAAAEPDTRPRRRRRGEPAE